MKSTYDFNNEDNYTFDSNKLEFVSGIVRLLAQIGIPEAAIYCKLDDNKGLVATDSSGNGRDGAFQGGYTESQWVPGKINSGIQGISVNNGFINFDQLLEFERTDAFSLECWIKTTSSSTMSFISKQASSGNFQGFAINCLVGKVRLVVRDVLGNVLSIENNTAINNGSWHHIVMTYDGTSVIGGCHIYVDNAENDNIISSNVLTDTIKTTADLQISGRDGNNLCIDSDTVIDECVVYARELTSAEITFRWNNGNGTQTLPGPGTTFPTDNPSLLPQSNIRITEFTGFNATITATGNNNVFFVIVINGSRKYWNGSAWVDSNGYPETNTYQEINTNASNLILAENVSFNWEAFFHSHDGSETPQLDQVTFDYNFQTVSPVFTDIEIIGNLRDLTSALSGESFRIRPTWTIGTNTLITGKWVDIITDQNGDFFIPVKVEDVDPTFLEWQIQDKIYKTNFLNQPIVKFSDFTIIWENETEIDYIGN